MIRAAHNWPTNGDMIADVAKLGYITGTVLDVTYGEGNFWTVYRPEHLVTNDLYKPGADWAWDYRSLPLDHQSFSTVVVDPPYRLSGTRDRGDFDARFGTDVGRSCDEVLTDIVAGAVECFRVCQKYLLVKCQDQVASGRKRWQTDIVTRAVEQAGGRKVDRFDLITRLRPQPAGRRQVTSRSNYSTLLVFRKV